MTFAFARLVARRGFCSTTYAKPLERALARRSLRPAHICSPLFGLRTNAFLVEPDAFIPSIGIVPKDICGALFSIDVHPDAPLSNASTLLTGFIPKDIGGELFSIDVELDVPQSKPVSVTASSNRETPSTPSIKTASAKCEVARRPSVGDHVLIKDTERTRRRFSDGIGKVFVITSDDQAFLPYQCEGGSAWLREEDVKLWEAAPLLKTKASFAASKPGRPTVGDRVLIKDTKRTRRQFVDGIGKAFVIRTDDQVFLPYQCEGSSVWLREEDVMLEQV